LSLIFAAGGLFGGCIGDGSDEFFVKSIFYTILFVNLSKSRLALLFAVSKFEDGGQIFKVRQKGNAAITSIKIAVL
jgi:hypothetical protein